jgi:phosphoribosylglycinamide formyltransferase-1
VSERQTKTRLAVLISGSGSNLQAIIDGCANGSIPAEVCLVLSNKADAYGLVRAQQAGIASRVLDHRDFPDRESYDTALGKVIDEYAPDAVLLAGFMRILTPAFVARFSGRMLNIHPSLLPRFTGLHTHRRALEAGDTRHGASVHFVTEELDGGPVILQAWVPVEPNDDERRLAARVLQREHLIYPTVARWFAEGRLAFSNGQILCDGKALPEPILLGPDEEPPF